MEYPLVSVIMPVYNAELFLKRAIDSMLMQTYSTFEFIIIDDGSTDNSNTIIKNYSDKQIKLIENKENKGLIYSLNIGINEAKGKYIARMDADDISYPKRIEKQVNFLETHPTIGVLGTFINDTIKYKIYKNKQLTSNDLKARLIFDNAFYHPTVMFRASALKENKILYDQNYKHAEDYNLWIKLMSVTDFAILQEPLLYYENHSHQVSSKHSIEQENSIFKTQDNFFNSIQLHFTDEELELHKKLFYNQFEYTENHLIKIEAWLIKLKSNLFFQSLVTKEALDKSIAVIWFEVCTHFASKGVKCLKIYRNSLCRNDKFISLFYRVIFIFKNIPLKRYKF
ncbi:MAG: glycosyltransferase [Bacteroidetes bacterium]|nr:glycosyltransferase [Bacteroidota bacterium]